VELGRELQHAVAVRVHELVEGSEGLPGRGQRLHGGQEEGRARPWVEPMARQGVRLTLSNAILPAGRLHQQERKAVSLECHGRNESTG